MEVIPNEKVILDPGNVLKIFVNDNLFKMIVLFIIVIRLADNKPCQKI